MRYVRDMRFWFGLGVTVLCLWLALRDVDLNAIGRALMDAEWWLIIVVAMPFQVAAIYLRAVRWQLLTDPIMPIPLPPLCRATFIGFAGNNLLPLRVGEFIRAWALAREVGSPATPFFGTIVFERVIDTLCFVAMIVGVLTLHSFGDAGQISPGGVTAIAIIGLCGLVIVRFFPNPLLKLLEFCLRPLPEGWAARVGEIFRDLILGISSLRGVKPVLGIVIYSFLLWGVLVVVPFLVGMEAAGVRFDTPQETLLAAFCSLVVVIFFISAPSAPGFFGTYRLALQFALADFGVPPEQGFVVGVLVHLSYWLPVTAIGLFHFVRLRSSLNLEELSDVQAVASISKDPPE
ncbi:MAG: flippase-like domain-containing protein [Deltaproteobacteria bacterium]|nr:flippase-like domain-containing protein [Deltaproteobacteria bacterium]